MEGSRPELTAIDSRTTTPALISDRRGASNAPVVFVDTPPSHLVVIVVTVIFAANVFPLLSLLTRSLGRR